MDEEFREELLLLLGNLYVWEITRGDGPDNIQEMARAMRAMQKLEDLEIPKKDSGLKHMTSHGREAKAVVNHPSIKLIDGKS